MQIALPPLREHPSDVPLLVNYYVDQFNREFRKKVRGASPEALELLQAYRWPGQHPRAAQCGRARDAAGRRRVARRRHIFRSRSSRATASGAMRLARGRRAASSRLERELVVQALTPHRREPDEGGGAAGSQSRPDPLSHREVRAREDQQPSANNPPRLAGKFPVAPNRDEGNGRARRDSREFPQKSADRSWHTCCSDGFPSVMHENRGDMVSREQVESVLGRIRPLMQADGGDIELVDVTGNNAHVRLTGMCAGLPERAHDALHGRRDGAARRDQGIRGAAGCRSVR